jgi:hypothetical protein
MSDDWVERGLVAEAAKQRRTTLNYQCRLLLKKRL